MRWLGGLALLALTGYGCSPALDWREVRPDGAGLVMLFPCRPAVHAREVALAGRPTRLQLHSCSTDGVTWALALADVEDPARVGAALRELRRSAAGNLGAVPGPLEPWPIPGQTPQPDSGRVTVSGHTPQGASIVSRAAFFSRGTLVFQVTALGGQPAAQSLEPFFTGIRLMTP